MKILYYHYTSSKDGQYIHISSIISALRSLGHDVRLVGPALPGNAVFGRSNISALRLKQSIPQFAYEILELVYGLIDFFRLFIISINYRPDFIYYRYNVYSPSALLVGRTLRVPILMEVNSPLAEERSEFGGLEIKFLARWLEVSQWCSADHIFSVSAVLRDYIQAKGVPARRLTVLPNAIDLDRFQSIPDLHLAKVSLGIEAFQVIGFVGFMREWHGLEQLLDWLANSAPPNVMLLLVGDGPARQGLEQQARNLGIASRVMITGVVDPEKIPRYLAAFDIAVLPNAVRYASPLKILEYMAAGRAILAPSQANIRELLQDGNTAILFQTGNIFLDLEKLIKNDQLRCFLGRNAKKYVVNGNLTWNENAECICSTASKISMGKPYNKKLGATQI